MQRAMVKIGQISLSSSALFVCDIQEIFRERIYNMPSVIQGARTLVQVGKELDLPTIVTTQYAARFGPTSR